MDKKTTGKQLSNRYNRPSGRLVGGLLYRII